MIDRVKLVTMIRETRRMLMELHRTNAEQRLRLEHAIDQLSDAIAELEGI